MPTAPIAKIEDLVATFEQLRERCNLITPIAAVDSIMPMHQVSLRTVMIDTTLHGSQGPDCYQDKRFCADDEVALGKNGLAKLMNAGGVQIVEKRRLDDRAVLYLWEIEVVLAVRDFDGTLRQVIATKELDLRDGAPDTVKPERFCRTHNDANCKSCQWKNFKKTGKVIPIEDSALSDKRRHGQSLCETMAIERGLRLMFALPQKLKIEDAAKPFVIPKLVFLPDLSDPEVKTAVLNHGLAGESALYGPPENRRGRPYPQLASHSETGSQFPPASEPPQPPLARPQDAVGVIDADASVAAEDDMPSFEVVTPEPAKANQPEATCGCPCGDDQAISAVVAKMTGEQGGSARCASCWPGKDFDYKAHSDLPDLKLEKFGSPFTPEKADEMARAARVKAQKKAS